MAGTVRASVQREGQTYTGGSLAARYASLVKLPHTLFALPFAGVGAVLGSWYASIVWLDIVWIVLAFTAARFAAMAFNRILDRHWDALNPRTAAREIPAGALSVRQAGLAVVGASALFIIAAWLLNPLCGTLAPFALAWVFFYSYTKRFTASAHHVLGFALAMAPVGAYLAVTAQWSVPWYALMALAAGVTFWVGGFDIIYALQDLEFDRAHALHSVPAVLGAERALLIARLSHLIAVTAFLAIWAWQLFPVGALYLAAVVVMGVVLCFEHYLAAGMKSGRTDLRTVDRAFFNANVAISTSFLLLTLVDRLAS